MIKIAFYAWCRKWQLSFKPDKCKTIHFGANNPRYNYNLNEQIVEKSTTGKDLGVNFDDKLKFSEHVGIITARANSKQTSNY